MDIYSHLIGWLLFIDVLRNETTKLKDQKTNEYLFLKIATLPDQITINLFT